MSEALVFISYSRQQLYFAESLALNLRAAGIQAWMDIQQLAPGSSWSDRIREGLRKSTMLVLVASRHALKSPYVQEEWTAALNANKPIYIIYFESVQLPDALSNNPQISHFNFRRQFDRKVMQLIACMKSGQVHRDPISAWRFIIPPIAHWVVAVSLLIPTFILLTWLAALFATGFGHFFESFNVNSIRELFRAASIVTSWGYLGVAGIVFLIGFLFRHFDGLSLKWLPGMYVVWLWFAYRALDPITHGQSIFQASTEDVPLYTDNFVFIEMGLIGLAYLSFHFQRKSADILRWLPLGQASTEMRAALNTRFLKNDAGPSNIPAVEGTYQIFYDPADELVAQEVESRLQAFRYRRLNASDTQPAILTVFVLSNYSDLEKLKQEAGMLPKLAMAVVASSFKMPASPEDIFRFQWLDYRRRTDDQICQINKQSLQPDKIMTIQSSFTIDPESMERFVVPKGVFFATNALRSLGTIVLSAGLCLLVLSAIGKDDTLRGGLTIALGLAMFWLAARLTERRVHHWEFMIGYGVLWLTMFGLGVNDILWSLLRYYGADIYTGQPTLYGYMYQAVLLLTPPALVIYYRKLIERWLPRAAKRTAKGKPLQLRTTGISWFIYLFAVLELTLTFLSFAQF